MKETLVLSQRQREWVTGSKLSELPYGDCYLFSHFTDEETRVEDMRVTCLE